MPSERTTFPAEWLKKPFTDMTDEELWTVMRSRRVGGMLARNHEQTLSYEPAEVISLCMSKHFGQDWRANVDVMYKSNSNTADRQELIDQLAELFVVNEWEPFASCSHRFYTVSIGVTVVAMMPWCPMWVDDSRTSVSVYESLDHLHKNRRTNIKVGRFLRRLVTCDVDDTKLGLVCQAIAAHGKVELKFAVTAAEMAQVYRDGPHSCMAYPFHGLPRHPAEVYCYPLDRETLDCENSNYVAVAYLGEIDAATARTVVYVDGDVKHYVRVYGDNSIIPVLEKAGFTQSQGTLDDVPLSVIPDGDTYVFPYIDYRGYARLDEFIDPPAFFLESFDSDADIMVQSTDGTADPMDRYTCDDCGERLGENDRYYVEDNDTYVCQSCYDDNYCDARTGRRTETTTRQDNAVEINGIWYHNDYVHSVAFCCEDCGEWYLSDGDTGNYTINDSTICDECAPDYAERHDYVMCDGCGCYTHEDNDECSECGHAMHEEEEEEDTPFVPTDRTPGPDQLPLPIDEPTTFAESLANGSVLARTIAATNWPSTATFSSSTDTVQVAHDSLIELNNRLWEESGYNLHLYRARRTAWDAGWRWSRKLNEPSVWDIVFPGGNRGTAVSECLCSDCIEVNNTLHLWES